MIRHSSLAMALLLLIGADTSREAHADGTLHLAEQEIKAGLLYNFLKYTEWPPAGMKNGPPGVVVCIFGDDPFGEHLKPMAGRTVNQRGIILRSVQSARETDVCHLLFVNADEKARWPELRNFLVGKGVLTVSDFKDFVQSGGMIELGRKDNRINVELNIEAVTAAGLHVQERLLRLVTVVNPASQKDKR